jgi:hypothetical protein
MASALRGSRLMRWRTRGRPIVAILTVMLAAVGCATTPTGPSVLVLPAEGRSHEDFRADDARCRAVAAAELQTTAGGYVSAQGRYDMVYIQCMYAAGHQVPVRGAPLRSRDVPPPPPGSAPPPPASSAPTR